MPGRWFDRLTNRPKLLEIQVVIQDLAGVVEDGGRFRGVLRQAQEPPGMRGGGNNDFLQGFVLKVGTCDEFVEIINIGLQVLPVVESQCLVADHRRQGLIR